MSRKEDLRTIPDSVIKPIKYKKQIERMQLENLAQYLRGRHNFYQDKAREFKKAGDLVNSQVCKDKKKETLHNLNDIEGKIRELDKQIDVLDQEMAFVKGRLYIVADYFYQCLADFEDFVNKHAHNASEINTEQFKQHKLKVASLSFEFGDKGKRTADAYSVWTDIVLRLGNTLMTDVFRQSVEICGNAFAPWVMDQYLPKIEE